MIVALALPLPQLLPDPRAGWVVLGQDPTDHSSHLSRMTVTQGTARGCDTRFPETCSIPSQLHQDPQPAGSGRQPRALEPSLCLSFPLCAMMLMRLCNPTAESASQCKC